MNSSGPLANCFCKLIFLGRSISCLGDIGDRLCNEIEVALEVLRAKHAPTKQRKIADSRVSFYFVGKEIENDTKWQFETNSGLITLGFYTLHRQGRRRRYVVELEEYGPHTIRS